MYAADCRLAAPIMHWTHEGRAMPRGNHGDCDSEVTGDPCIVWDDQAHTWRMFYFAQSRDHAGNECNAVAHALADNPSLPGPGSWRKLGRIAFTNPHIVGDRTHKPWILMDPTQPNRAVRFNGKYLLFTVTYVAGHKCIHVAEADALEGPWTLRETPALEPGPAGDFDQLHVDTVTAYWFQQQQRVLLFYKGYPAVPQNDQPDSPLGSSTAVAQYDPLTHSCRKMGRILTPVSTAPHFNGWISTVQLFPAHDGGYLGLISGSPTPPAPLHEQPHMREPPPSLGGWARTPHAWPVQGWTLDPRPITTLQDIPVHAQAWGERVNLWRHHLVLLADGTAKLFYNSGSYGQESMFCRTGRWR